MFAGAPDYAIHGSAARERKRTFPPTLQRTRQWCKRIRSKLYYFGVDKQAAYEQYLREATDLHAGRQRATSVIAAGMTIKELANHDLLRAIAGIGTVAVAVAESETSSQAKEYEPDFRIRA